MSLRDFDAGEPQNIVNQLSSQVGVFDVDQQQEWQKKQEELKSLPIFKCFEDTECHTVAQIPNFTLNPAMAVYIDKNYNQFMAQRGRTRRRTEMIGCSILNKTWNGNRLILALLGEDYITEDGMTTRTLLLNGGHTVGVCMEYGLTAQHNILQMVYCPRIKDASDLYLGCDRPESSRSAKEQAKSIVAGREDLKNWMDESDGHIQSGIFSNCLTAAMVANFGTSYRGKGLTEKVKNEIAEEKYKKEMYWLKNYIYDEPKSPKHVKRVVGVLGPMLLSHSLWGDACEWFWDDVKSGWANCPTESRHRMNPAAAKRSPQGALYHYLLSSQNGGAKEDEVTVYGKVITALNAWASGQKHFTFQGKRGIWDKQLIEMTKFKPHAENVPDKEEAA